MDFHRRFLTALVVPALALVVGCPAEEPNDDSSVVSMTQPMSSSITNDTGPGMDTGDDTTSTGEAPPSDSSSGGGSGTDTGGSDSGDSTGGGNGGQLCGNGIIEGSEQCDCAGMPCSPAGLGNNTSCLGLFNPSFPDRHYTGGILDCNPASCQFKFNTCTWCGDTEQPNGMELCELGDLGPSCQELGQGTSTNPLPCAETCIEWDTTCCAMPLPKECM